MITRCSCLLLLATCILGATSCRREPKIQSYIVPKEATQPVAVAVESAEPTDRMLTAILPDSGQAWFLKVVGPVALVDSSVARIDEFFASVRPAAGKPHPDWKLPEGWQQQAGSGMRAATIIIPASGAPLQLSVTALPWSGAPGELLNNVNRWRGQLQLPPTNEQGIAESTRELKAGDKTLTVVDLRGRFQSGGMAAPFAGGAMPPFASAPVTNPPVTDASALPPGHPPISSTAPADNAPFTYETPAGWKSLPVSGLRKAAFQIGDANKETLLTVIDFPADAGPMMADPLANVRRWRGEVGLAELDDAGLKATMSPVEIDGFTAQLVDATPSSTDAHESKINRGTLAAMLTRGDTIWFFKLSGDRDLVAAERDRFTAFLKSVHFAGNKASDGN